MSNNTLLKGAMWGTFAVFLSKILGFIYIIPFNKFLEVDQQIVFTSSYRIYAYVLLIATAGIPFATANMIAKYNSHKNYLVSFKLLRSNIILMFIIGLICATGLVLLSQPLAHIIITTESNPEVIANVATGIKLIALALIFVPIISVIRGFFQGYKEIKISSVSQVVEQFINSTFILAALLLAGAGLLNNLIAVYFAILCATLGSVASLVYLVVQYKKMNSIFKTYYLEGEKTNSNQDIPLSKLYKELVMISFPYIGVILLAQSNDLIDLLYTIRGLVANGFSIEAAKEFSTIYGLSVNKLLTIPMTISTGLSVALIPHLSEAYAQRNRVRIQELISSVFEGTAVILIPISLLMMATSYEILYLISAGRNAEYGSYIFNYFAIYSIINTFTIIVDNAMLSLAQRKRALIFISIATIFKLTSTFFLISWLGIFGLALSSILTCLISLVPAMIVLKRVFKISYAKFFRTIFYSLAASAIMYLTVYYLAQLIVVDTFVGMILKTALLYIIGIAIYGIIALKLNLIPYHIRKRLFGRFIK